MTNKTHFKRWGGVPYCGQTGPVQFVEVGATCILCQRFKAKQPARLERIRQRRIQRQQPETPPSP